MELSPRQQDLYLMFVQAAGKKPGCLFEYAPAMGWNTVEHPGLPHGCVEVDTDDIDALADRGYIEYVKLGFILTKRSPA